MHCERRYIFEIIWVHTCIYNATEKGTFEVVYTYDSKYKEENSEYYNHLENLTKRNW